MCVDGLPQRQNVLGQDRAFFQPRYFPSAAYIVSAGKGRENARISGFLADHKVSAAVDIVRSLELAGYRNIKFNAAFRDIPFDRIANPAPIQELLNRPLEAAACRSCPVVPSGANGNQFGNFAFRRYGAGFLVANIVANIRCVYQTRRSGCAPS